MAEYVPEKPIDPGEIESVVMIGSAGVWKWNDVLPPFSTPVVYDVVFYSSGIKYTSIRFEVTQIYYDSTEVFSASWLNEACKTISIPEDISVDLYNILEDNATQISTTPEIPEEPTAPVASKFLDESGLREAATKITAYVTKKLREVS